MPRLARSTTPKTSGIDASRISDSVTLLRMASATPPMNRIGIVIRLPETSEAIQEMVLTSLVERVRSAAVPKDSKSSKRISLTRRNTAERISPLKPATTCALSLRPSRSVVRPSAATSSISPQQRAM